MNIGKIGQFGFAAAIALAGGQAAAQGASDCGLAFGKEHGDWQIYQSLSECPRKECGARSMPVSTVNTRNGAAVNVRRGNIRLFVTVTSLNSAETGLVSFNSGYPFAQGSDVSAKIDGSAEFSFQIGQEDDHEEWAWPSQTDDERLVGAMKKGNRIVVSGISGRGTRTTDTFSLKGFTAALQDAVELCSQ